MNDALEGVGLKPGKRIECWRKLGQFIRMIQEDHTMNKDIFEGKWKQMRGQAKDWWGKLTDDDLERVGGKYDKFVGLLQEKYGYTRERAEEEINRRTAEHEAQQKKVPAK